MPETSMDALRQRREEIARQMKVLAQEDAELAVAEQVFKRLSGGLVGAESRPPSKRRPGTQKEFVLQALETSQKAWVSAAEIIDLVRAQWGIVIPERSLRPLLSNMKGEGEIVRAGRVVALYSRGRETPAHGPAKDRR